MKEERALVMTLEKEFLLAQMGVLAPRVRNATGWLLTCPPIETSINWIRKYIYGLWLPFSAVKDHHILNLVHIWNDSVDGGNGNSSDGGYGNNSDGSAGIVSDAINGNTAAKATKVSALMAAMNDNNSDGGNGGSGGGGGSGSCSTGRCSGGIADAKLNQVCWSHENLCCNNWIL